jgi:transposase
MALKVHFRQATVKTLHLARQQAWRAGDLRVIRRVTALLDLRDQEAAAVAEGLGVSETTVYRWLAAFIGQGVASLRYRTSPGRPAKLTPTQKERLKALLRAGPEAAGYPTGCWNSALIQDLIYQEFGVLYNVHYLSTLLANLGYSYQKARFVSDHLDEERRRVWREETWPTLLRLARAQGALLLFGDEASFAQWGSLGYTWAPRGEQPLIKTCGRRKAAKVFGLIDYFSGRFFSRTQTERFTADTYCAFLEQVLAATTHPLIVIQDGAKYHTAARTQEFVAAPAARLNVYQLPSYSPDDNPIEHLWRNTKRRSTHCRYFPTFEALCAAVEEGLTHFAAHPAEVKRLMGSYLAETVEIPAAA